MSQRILHTLSLFFLFSLSALAAEAIPPIPRVLPPEGIEIPADVRARLESRLAVLKKRLDGVNDAAIKPDIEVFTKAVELALIHREFYVERDFAKADWALDEANERLDSLATGQSPWTKATGLVVEGYRSSIDGSAQPYGLVIPKDHDLTKPCPLYVWLHGRGDKNTDLHFLQERATRPGQIAPPNAIVVHPFGRHCVGWKHAGEIDVLSVVSSVRRRYEIDPNRVVLIGFSMGGAGSWHIGAHYTDQWLAVSPGAGFVDTARYQKITADRYPEWYVQKLWGLYDVPGYVRNLFNTSVIAYSGELDKQREAAVIMEEAYQSEGRMLTHLIGPGVEHKYEPKTLDDLMQRLKAIVDSTDLDSRKYPNEIHLQTRTLRYSRQNWVAAEELEEHWKDSRIDAKRSADRITLKTANINRLSITAPSSWIDLEVDIDAQPLGKLVKPGLVGVGDGLLRRTIGKEDGQWKFTQPDYQPFVSNGKPMRKGRWMQGPIDDAFMSPFFVVVPSGKSRNPAFQAWCDAELNHFRDRWRALMRAELPTVSDRSVNSRWTRMNLIVWGDPDSNSFLASLLAKEQVPIRFDAGRWTFGATTFDGNRFVPQFVFPHQASPSSLPGGYIVLNSGLTFREGHDRTNSQQNPKLPDWAIIDMTQPPDAFSPGRIHDADFFDEEWKLKRQPRAP